ncbi:hypothetical protein [Helicobacter sp.]|nr:hypothetical protein [Helicobacter sp.]
MNGLFIESLLLFMGLFGIPLVVLGCLFSFVCLFFALGFFLF